MQRGGAHVGGWVLGSCNLRCAPCPVPPFLSGPGCLRSAVRELSQRALAAWACLPRGTGGLGGGGGGGKPVGGGRAN
jgi:hypothetical protein